MVTGREQGVPRRETTREGVTYSITDSWSIPTQCRSKAAELKTEDWV